MKTLRDWIVSAAALVTVAVFGGLSIAADPPELRLPDPTPREVYATYARVLASGESWEATITQTAAAWKVSKGKGVKVGVFDTGVDDTHPELKGKVRWKKDYTGSPSGAADKQGHGTFCASEIVGAVNIDGPAPEAEIYSFKVLGDNGSGNFDWLTAAVKDAKAMGIEVYSISIGSGKSTADPNTFVPSMRAALKAATDSGAVVCVAMGNSGPSYPSGEFPGRYPEVIAVAAVDANRQVGSFSSRDDAVYCSAPGVDVLGALPGGRYAKWDGTSMATPWTAAVAATYVSHAKSNATKPSQAEFKRLLRETCVTSNPKRPNPNSGYGLIQALDLLNKVPTVGPPPPAGDTLSIDFGRPVGSARVDGNKVVVTLGVKPADAVFAAAQLPRPLGPPPTPAHEWGEIPGHGVGWRLRCRRGGGRAAAAHRGPPPPSGHANSSPKRRSVCSSHRPEFRIKPWNSRPNRRSERL
jgi:major intracellular serine protease